MRMSTWPWSEHLKPSNLSSQLLVRSLEDLLAAERRWRQAAEQRAKALTEVLTRLAYDLGLGEALEQARRANPRALETWGAVEWAALFRQAMQQSQGWNGNGHKADLEAALQARDSEIAQLRQQLAQLQARLHTLEDARQTQERTKRKTKAFAPEPEVLGLDLMAQALNEVDWQTLRIPEMYRPLAKTGGVRWQRGLMMLFLINRFGINSRMELALALAQAHGKPVKTGRAWVRKAGAYLTQNGLLIAETLRLSSPPTSLSVYRLSNEGRDLAQRLGWDPVESEWERLRRLHEGDRYPAHTMAVLTAALHARLRGWKVAVMPEKSTNTPTDMLISRKGERWFVEVELSEKDNPAKWRNNAQENNDQVALVAATAERRRTLVNDCKRLGLSGKATDLETLIAVPLDEITPDTPFWAEEWKT